MTVARFRRIVTGPDPALDEAVIALAGALGPPLDEIEWLARLDELAGDCPTPTPEGIARHLFRDLGFHGNRDDYYDWRNSCIDHVLARRTGIPISLAVVMIEVGRRLGVPLVGANVPRHFLVRTPDAPDTPARYFDPFDGGTELDDDGVVEMIARMGAEGERRGIVEAVGTLPILVRMLTNLYGIFTRSGDRARLANVAAMRRAIPPPDPRLERALRRHEAIWN